MSDAGERLKALLAKGCVTAPGAFDGLSVRLAAQAGFEAVYMTGFGVAGSLLGKPDIGLVSASEMMERVCVLAEAASPALLIADGDNGHGGVLNVAELVRSYEASGAAAIQIEDQVIPKRCGHMDGKELVPVAEAAAKIRAACAARRSPHFQIIARTDARAVEGFEAALVRARAYRKAGADIIFVEAPRGIDELRAIVDAFPGVPLMDQHGRRRQNADAVSRPAGRDGLSSRDLSGFSPVARSAGARRHLCRDQIRRPAA